ncbi:ATP-binding protein [Hydrogenophaga sp.]|uniref:AlbA family DNA-binding domain-containing protein n=1 Tax=Hydrogenophaga sp. TaxID=1904254 RepID=UPI00286DD51C|nr:ATP-binding protein [Hydrogenophaga sp.]
MPLPRDLASLTEAHFDALIAEQATEGSYLDFKRNLPGRDAAAKNEVTADVSAFANSSGGDLIYGIDEDGEGRAASVVPQVGNRDETARWFQDVLMSSIEPRVPGIQVQAVDVAGGFVLVVRVPQSWAGPHRVTSNQHFYVRENGRKRQLNVPEIRGLFLRSEQQAQRVRDFRTERLGKLLSGEGPHPLVPGSLLVCHFVPTQAALGLVNVDPVRYTVDNARRLPVLGMVGLDARINLDGALAVRNPNPRGTFGYSQLFRSGFFETVKVLESREGGHAALGSQTYEEQVIRVLDLLREEYLQLGVGLEMTCMVSILGAKRVELGLDKWRYHLEDHQGYFDRDAVVLPDVLLAPEVPSAKAMRPVFDLVWQAAGLPGSDNYDDTGEWRPRR